MDTAEMLFLALVLVAFATFSGTVMWVLNDDVRNRARRDAARFNDNSGTTDAVRAA
jgi:hypothetical protein